MTAARTTSDPSWLRWGGALIALACALFTFAQLRPDLILADTTPAGGDMGAHVWAPAFLRDNLLTQGRLAGWSPDWYAGLPLYQFYMVVPALAIIALNVGFGLVLGPLLAAAVVAGLALDANRRGLRWWHPAVGIAAAVALVGLPYGVAFKVVAVSGLVAMPICGWAMARWARSPEPVPPLVALGVTVFLFDTNFNIYGGNILSTLAGEFAFSISLALTLLALGLAFRGLDADRGRVVAAIVIALVALTHIIPLFFLMAGLILLVAFAPGVPRGWILGLGAIAALGPVAFGEQNNWLMLGVVVASWLGLLAVLVLAEPELQRRFRWMLVTGPTAALMACFWIVPFVGREAYFNDMGWERLNEVGEAMLTTPMRVALPLAAVGAVLSFAARDRVGMLFTSLGLLFAAFVANLGPAALWNARLLPFFYLSTYLVAAVGIARILRLAAAYVAEQQELERPEPNVLAGATVVASVAALIGLSVPLRALPTMDVEADGTASFLGLTSTARSAVPSWTAWNFSGYERKPSYREYRDIVTTMDEVGADNGCGRAMWEYDRELDRYGTPMALMLLPHWTDGCIGSMEGLYFESSATTPFHFLNQSVLSENPSRAQRDLPYLGYDLERGIEQLRVMGVRYYLALSDTAIADAREHPGLRELTESPPWVVFEIEDWALVEGLDTEPVVAAGPDEEQMGELATRFELGWVSQAVAAYNDPARFAALPAEDGPDEWERVDVLIPSDGEPLTPVTVDDIAIGTDEISFSVDRTGSPVLVKASYFPNWEVEGGEGPWRVGPNLMAVVPTSEQVRLTYGYTPLEYLAYLLTALGLAGLGGLWWLDRRSPAVASTMTSQRPTPRPMSTNVTTVTDPQSALDAIVKAYDIRGTYPDQIDADLCRALGVGFARHLRAAEPDATEVIVARDMRPSGPELSGAFADGVRSQGLDVLDIGLASTDMLYYASGSLGAPGAMFTASHNPAGYNGIKVCGSSARPIGEDSGLAEMKAIAVEALTTGVDDAPEAGSTREQDLLGAFADHVRSFLQADGLRPLKVVADTANGMGGYVVPAAFEGLPFELEVLFPELDGTFPNHPADPIQVENLADLRERVVETGADIGLAFDGDADRVFLVDERGEPVSGSLTTALLARAILADEPGGKVVHNLICSKTVPEVIRESGGEPIRTRVGHSFIKAVMAEEGAVFGGEHSAHYYFRDNWRADSGLIASMMVLGVLGSSEQSLSELLAPLQRYAASGEINTRVSDAAAVIEKVAAHYEAEGHTIDRLDGLTVDAGDWWFNLRPSNTEPLLRLNLEAADTAAVEARVAEVRQLMEG